MSEFVNDMDSSNMNHVEKEYEDSKIIPTSDYSTFQDVSSIDQLSHITEYTEFDEMKPDKSEIQHIAAISVFDVAKYVLKRIGTCTTMKLHKLLYYSQAWNMVWEEKILFKERIEAWASGPVIRELFNYHKGLFDISYWDMAIGNDEKLNSEQKESVDAVLAFYGNKSAQWLIDQTHMEHPWGNARKGLSTFERGNSEISLDDMFIYYSSLYAESSPE